MFSFVSSPNSASHRNMATAVPCEVLICSPLRFFFLGSSAAPRIRADTFAYDSIIATHEYVLCSSFFASLLASTRESRVKQEPTKCRIRIASQAKGKRESAADVERDGGRTNDRVKRVTSSLGACMI